VKAFRGCEVDLLFDPNTVAHFGRLLVLASAALLVISMTAFFWLNHQVAASEQVLRQMQAEQLERETRAAAKRDEEAGRNSGLRLALDALAYPWHKEFEALDRVGRRDTVALLSWSVERATGEGRVTLLAESFDAVQSSLDDLNDGSEGVTRWRIVQLTQDSSVQPFTVRALLVRQRM